MFPWAAFVREPHLERLFTIISPFMELHMKLAMKANQHLERNPTEWKYLMSRDDFIQWTHYDASFSVYDEWRFRVDMFPLPSCHNCLLQSLCRFYFIWWHTAHYARGMENLFFFLSRMNRISPNNRIYQNACDDASPAQNTAVTAAIDSCCCCGNRQYP